MVKDFGKCDASATGKHEANPATLQLADGGELSDLSHIVVDVACLHCGQSGSTSVDLTEIQWE